MVAAGTVSCHDGSRLVLVVCRFTDSEQQRLFQAIQLYVTMFSSANPEPDSPALGLVEDALKMPFTGAQAVIVVRSNKRQAPEMHWGVSVLRGGAHI